jgi:type VI secretion system protein ImpM
LPTPPPAAPSGIAADARAAPDGPAPGWFGKLAGLGDFAHRRLPPPWLQACDAWVSRGLAASRERLGEQWLAVYLTSPPQRFAWAPGVIDERWWFGLFMPSCDNAGRYFPLLIAEPRDDAPRDAAALEHLERWYGHVVGAALQTLDERGAPVDALEAALRQAPPWPPASEASAPTSPLAGLHAVPGGTALPRWLASFAAGALCDILDGCSLWWPVDPEGGPGPVRIVRGLPWDEDFADLLAAR